MHKLQTLPYRRLRPIRSLGEYQAQTNLLMNVLFFFTSPRVLLTQCKAVNGRPSGGEGPSVDGFSQLTLDTLQQLMGTKAFIHYSLLLLLLHLIYFISTRRSTTADGSRVSPRRLLQRRAAAHGGVRGLAGG